MDFTKTMQDLYYAHMAENLEEVYNIADQMKISAHTWSELQRFIGMCVVNATIESLTQ